MNLRNVGEMHEDLDRRAAKRRLECLDAGIVRGSDWRAFRRMVLFVAMIVCVVEFIGVPSLRVTYTERGGRILSGQYWSITGSKTLSAGDVSSECPLIAMIPLEESLVSMAVTALGMDN